MSDVAVAGAEHRAVAKFLRRMMPILVLMLLVNNLDRTNVGFIQDELRADVGVGATAYGLGAGLFFIGYALFEVHSNMLLERFGARVWLTRIMITWGPVIVAMCFIHNVTMFYVPRPCSRSSPPAASGAPGRPAHLSRRPRRTPTRSSRAWPRDGPVDPSAPHNDVGSRHHRAVVT
ncbi:MFS transporter, partial [Streptomyces sp. NPDC059467]|uniref:MFS transporter n=1 Tax=Streptomyces sp. NPDC059467 TaxID=3346844 RepID=UPI00369603F5